MKKIILASLLIPALAFGQTYPSPTFSSLTLQNPLPVSSGGTGVANAGSITLGGNFTTSGSNTLTLTTTGATNVTLPTSGTLLNSTTGATAGTNSNITSLTGLTTPLSVPQGGTGVATSTGTGSAVLSTSPSLTTPNLGTPSAATLTNATGLPVAGIAGLGTGVASALGSTVNGSGSIALSASPTFTGVPAAPTATAGTNTTQLATTQFVAASFAPLASPALTATPTAPTATAGTSTTQLATTAFATGAANAVKTSRCPSILSYGGDNTGATNNDTAFSSALSASPNISSYFCIYFPPGTYSFASQASVTLGSSYQSVVIEGSGASTTTLSWASNGGIKVIYKDGTDAVHIRGLTLTAGSVGAGTAITLSTVATTLASAALSTIENVDIRGSNGYFGTQYFNHGIDINSVSNVSMNNVNAIGPGTPAGIGLNLNGTSSVLGIVYNISNSTFDQWNDGINYGPYIQGVQVSNSNFTNNQAGIFVPASELGVNQLSVSNSQFNNITYNILANSAVPDVIITGNLFLIDNNSSGVNLQATSYFNIIGNAFQPNTGSPSNVFGVVINGWVIGAGIITGNMYYNLTDGNTLLSTSKNVNIQSNVYNACATNNANSGTGNVIGGGSP